MKSIALLLGKRIQVKIERSEVSGMTGIFMDKLETTIKSKSRSRGIERALNILDYLQSMDRPQRPSDIAAGLGAPTTSIYENIAILVSQGVLEKVDSDGRVFFGRKIYYWGLTYQRNFDITRIAKPFLDELAKSTRETVQLCTLEGNKYAVLMMREGLREFRISTTVGNQIPIPWTASGRLLLSNFSSDELLEFLPDEDFLLPDGKLLTRADLNVQIASAVSEQFFSFDSIVDNYTHCFAAPIYNEEGICEFTVCLIVPKQDAMEKFDAYRVALSNAANKLSTSLVLKDSPKTSADE